MVKLILSLLVSAHASAAEISLTDFLSRAWQSSSVSEGETHRRAASEALVSSVRGRYLPQVQIDGIDSWGFPASNGDLHVQGITASPFRSGLSGDLVVEQTIYDFGRIGAALSRAKADQSLSEARLTEEKSYYLLALGRLYLTCAKVRSWQEHDRDLLGWAEINLKETARFTKTGQRSIIDNALAKTEVDNLVMEINQLKKWETSLTAQMKLYGVEGQCKHLSDSWGVSIPAALQVEDPRVLIAKALGESAQAELASAKAAQLPEIKAMGSVGGMERSRLVNEENYAAGVGLAFPIWNGGEDARRERAFKSETEFQKQQLRTAELEFQVKLTSLRDEFSRNRATFHTLEENLKAVRKTMKVASERYRRLEGPLIDVREAFKQLRSMEIDRVDMMQSLGFTSLELGLLGQAK